MKGNFYWDENKHVGKKMFLVKQRSCLLHLRAASTWEGEEENVTII